MAYGVSMQHTTVPKDGQLALDPAATVHVVAATEPGPEVDRLIAAWRAAGSGALELLHVGTAPDGVAAVRFTDVAALVAGVADRLARARVGARLYVAGDEGFVREATAAALSVGLLADELRSEVTSSAARRVWCSHCRTVTEGVTTTLTPCAGCGCTLEVFHHFSRRRGAYLGFMADAEAPGDLPAAEVAWP